MGPKKHIDDVQPKTVDEHYQLLLDDRTTLDGKYTEVTPADLPEWFDEKLFKRAQSYYLTNMQPLGLANVAGLIAILSVPAILDVILFTKQSETVCLSFKRYSKTLLLIYALFYADVTDPNSKWYKALNVIRWKHANATTRCEKKGIHGIYQKDMVITQFGFIGYVLICPKSIGATNRPEEREAFNHFWRVVGHLLGIPDRMNLCRKTEAETTKLCERVGYELLAKHMANESDDFIQLINKALDGLWTVDVTLDRDAFIAYTYRITGIQYKKPLRLYSRLNMMYRDAVISLFNIPIIGTIVRTYFNYMLTASYWILENYPIGAWLAFGKKNAKLCVYPKIK